MGRVGSIQGGGRAPQMLQTQENLFLEGASNPLARRVYICTKVLMARTSSLLMFHELQGSALGLEKDIVLSNRSSWPPHPLGQGSWGGGLLGGVQTITPPKNTTQSLFHALKLASCSGSPENPGLRPSLAREKGFCNTPVTFLLSWLPAGRPGGRAEGERPPSLYGFYNLGGFTGSSMFASAVKGKGNK